jgi:U3 small nucleolar RNA-associated protein 20
LLSDWLRFFSSVDTPRSLSGAGALYADCSALVGHPLPTVQSLALDCLVRWGEPPLVKHRKHLAGLIDGKTFRENLTLFSVDSHHSSLTPEDRTLLLPLLSRILFSRLTRRVGRGSSKSGMASTRATIFAFFGGFAPQELRPLLDLMLAPIRMAVTPHAPQHSQPDVRQGGTGALPAGVTPNGKRRKKYKQAHGRGAPTPEPAPPTSASPLAISVWAGDAAGDRAASLRGVEGSTLLGVLRSLHEAVTQLGGSLLPYLPELLDTTNLVLRCAAAGAATHPSIPISPPAINTPQPVHAPATAAAAHDTTPHRLRRGP